MRLGVVYRQYEALLEIPYSLRQPVHGVQCIWRFDMARLALLYGPERALGLTNTVLYRMPGVGWDRRRVPASKAIFALAGRYLGRAGRRFPLVHAPQSENRPASASRLHLFLADILALEFARLLLGRSSSRVLEAPPA